MVTRDGLGDIMKIRLSINKKGARLYEGVHDIIDQESFAGAFAEVWLALHEKRLQATTSVGELMDVLNDGVLGELHGAEISIERL